MSSCQFLIWADRYTENPIKLNTVDVSAGFAYVRKRSDFGQSEGIMMTLTHDPGARQIGFVAPEHLITALDVAASREGTSRAHYVRRLLAEHLRTAGRFPVEAPAIMPNRRP